jgi:hypothetical protein
MDADLFSRLAPGYSHHARFLGDTRINPKSSALIGHELDFDQVDSSIRSRSP